MSGSVRGMLLRPVAVALVLVLAAGCTSSRQIAQRTATTAGTAGPAGASTAPSATPSPVPPPTLPRGGRTLFPGFRVVAYYGGAGTPALGVLGEGSPDAAARRLLAAARPFGTPTRPVLPAFELIATVAQASAGDDGNYSLATPPGEVDRYLTAVRKIKGLLVLDIQPGRSDFLRQVRRYERLLRQPDVGLALDPEWHMGPTQVPGKVIGSATAAEINAVSAYLAGIVARYRLPQKLFVIHQFTNDMVVDKAKVLSRPGLAVTFHIDGFGSRTAKRSKYDVLHVRPPFFNGFKLFYDEDIDRFSPKEALALRPAPDLFSYQ